MHWSMERVFPTRFPELGYRNDARSLWRVCYLEDGRARAVGPQYRTRAELLADLERYATDFGCAG